MIASRVYVFVYYVYQLIRVGFLYSRMHLSLSLSLLLARSRAHIALDSRNLATCSSSEIKTWAGYIDIKLVSWLQSIKYQLESSFIVAVCFVALFSSCVCVHVMCIFIVLHWKKRAHVTVILYFSSLDQHN